MELCYTKQQFRKKGLGMRESDKMKMRVEKNIEQERIEMFLSDLEYDIQDREKVIHNLKMFQNLTAHCGEKIVCKVQKEHQLFKDVVILKQVNPFCNIETSLSECAGSSYPFVGIQSGIVSISLADTKEELYFNPHIELFDFSYDTKNYHEKTLELEEISYGMNLEARLKILERLKKRR